MWGYKERQIWRQNAYLLRADGTERPALVWLKEYFHDHKALGTLNPAPRSNPMQTVWMVGAVILLLLSGGCAWFYLRHRKAH